MRRRVVIALVVAVGGCGRPDPKPATLHPAAAAKRPSSTALQDELWKLAPEGADIGVVFSQQGLASIEGAWIQIRRALATAPVLAPVNDQIDAYLTNKVGSGDLSLSTLGMSPGQGAAFFAWSAHDDHRMLLILPVADRDKFLDLVKGTKGKDADVLRGGATCKMVLGHYACAKPAEVLEHMGNGAVGKQMRIAAARGDIEIVSRIPAEGHAMDVAVAAEVQRGSMTVRAAVAGVPTEIASRIKGPDVTFDASLASGFVFAHVAPLLAGMTIPKLPLVPGVTLADVVGNIDGPVTIATPPGTFDIDGRVPMKDATPAETFVNQCASSPGLASLGATSNAGVCRIPVPALLHGLDIWVDDDQLRFGIKDAPAPVPQQPTANARELASGQWPLAFYGHGSLLAGGTDLASLFRAAASEKLLPGMRALMLLDELGVGVRVEGDTVRVLMVARTAFANPDDVVEKLLAIQPDQVLDGTADEAAKKIAAAAPASPLASDLRAGVGGILVPTFMLGVIAAVAIPAGMESMKAKRQPEGVRILEQIADQAKRHRKLHGAFPKGNTGPTPAKSCCTYPHDKCDEPSAWARSPWLELDIKPEKPHLYRYAYSSDGKTFEARAISDLDCDGNEAEWVMEGGTDASGAVTTSISKPPTGVY